MNFSQGLAKIKENEESRTKSTPIAMVAPELKQNTDADTEITKTCAVLGCEESKKTDSNLFFRFPEDETLRQIWADLTGRNNWTPTDYSYICVQHFSVDCFECLPDDNVVLTSKAVPSLKLPKHVLEVEYIDEETFDNEATENEYEDEDYLMDSDEYIDDELLNNEASINSYQSNFQDKINEDNIEQNHEDVTKETSQDNIRYTLKDNLKPLKHDISTKPLHKESKQQERTGKLSDDDTELRPVSKRLRRNSIQDKTSKPEEKEKLLKNDVSTKPLRAAIQQEKSTNTLEHRNFLKRKVPVKSLRRDSDNTDGNIKLKKSMRIPMRQETASKEDEEQLKHETKPIRRIRQEQNSRSSVDSIDQIKHEVSRKSVRGNSIRRDNAKTSDDDELIEHRFVKKSLRNSIRRGISSKASEDDTTSVKHEISKRSIRIKNEEDTLEDNGDLECEVSIKSLKNSLRHEKGTNEHSQLDLLTLFSDVQRMQRQAVALKEKLKSRTRMYKRQEKFLTHVREVIEVKKSILDQKKKKKSRILLSLQNKIKEDTNGLVLALPTRHSDDLKSFALSIYKYSPQAYIYIRNTLRTLLPSTEVLESWVSAGFQPKNVLSNSNLIKVVSELTDSELSCKVMLR